MPRHQLQPTPRTALRLPVGRFRAVLALLGAITVAVVIGILVLWPDAAKVPSVAVTHANGTVTNVSRSDCGPGSTACTIEAAVRIDSGPDRGGSTQLTFVPGATDPRLHVGMHIVMGRQGAGPGAVYAFADVQRGRPILVLVVLFAIVTLAVGGLRGIAAMLGLVFAGASLVVFVLPALLAGEPPVAVALVAGSAVALVVLPLSHGVTFRTAVALLGSLCGMAVAAVLAQLSIAPMHLTGLSSDEGATLSLLGSRSTVGGLVLFGAVIGALGVLNDVTVTQASAVFELSAAAPELDRAGLTRAAMRIGRDHIASTVYSLVLAYAGSAVPLLLLFSVTDQSVGQVLTSDSLAPEVASGLIGATALVLVVPLTTTLAALLVDRSGAGDGSAG